MHMHGHMMIRGQTLAEFIDSIMRNEECTSEDIQQCMDAKVPCQLNGALCLLKLKRYQEAVDLLDSLLEQDLKPHHHAKSLYRKGMAQEGLGKREVALKLYEDALKIDPEDPSIKAACKRLTVSQEDIDECMTFLETGKMPSFAQRPQNPADIHKRFPKLQESLDKAGFTISNFGINMG